MMTMVTTTIGTEEQNGKAVSETSGGTIGVARAGPSQGSTRGRVARPTATMTGMVMTGMEGTTM